MASRKQTGNATAARPRKKKLKGLTMDSTYAYSTLSTNILRFDLLSFLEEWVEDASKFQDMNRYQLATEVQNVQRAYREEQASAKENALPPKDTKKGMEADKVVYASTNKVSSQPNTQSPPQVGTEHAEQEIDETIAEAEQVVPTESEDTVASSADAGPLDELDAMEMQTPAQEPSPSDSPQNIRQQSITPSAEPCNSQPEDGDTNLVSDCDDGLDESDEEPDDIEKARCYLEILIKIARNDLAAANRSDNVMDVDEEDFENLFDNIHDQLSRSNVEDVIRQMVEQEHFLSHNGKHLDVNRWATRDQYNFKLMSKLVDILRENVEWNGGLLPVDEALDLIEELFSFWRDVKIGSKPLVRGKIVGNGPENIG